MTTHTKNISLTQRKTKNRFTFINLTLKKEKPFFFFICASLLLAGFVFPYPNIAMWLGFILAGYSAIANDSIQTIGTFIASNRDKKWWHLWLFIGTIFFGVVLVSWIIYDGDVTYQRLATKGLAQSPASFQYLQIAAPIVLLIITRLRMPVSTTFLLLSSFSTQSGAIFSMLKKSLSGYVIAFVVAIIIWVVFAGLIKKLLKGKAHFSWTIAQWITSGTLWAVWIMQDAANIAVYLPRQLSLIEFLCFASFIFLGLGLLFYLKGDKIQKVVDEKTEVQDVRGATIIDLAYGIILIYFTMINTIPMSTTWVFLGLLGGREIAIKLTSKKKKANFGKTFIMIGRDLLFALIGLLVSIIIAISVNPVIREEFFNYLNL